jgi:hypothetical protein
LAQASCSFIAASQQQGVLEPFLQVCAALFLSSLLPGVPYCKSNVKQQRKAAASSCAVHCCQHFFLAAAFSAVSCLPSLLLLLLLLAVSGCVRCIFIFRARDSTQGAVDALTLQLAWWGAMRSILLATAICYPIFALLAITTR